MGSLYPSKVTTLVSRSYPDAYKFWYNFSNSLEVIENIPLEVSEKSVVRIPLKISASRVVKLMSEVPKTTSFRASTGFPLAVGIPLSMNLS